MNAQLFINAITCITFFLLAFIALANPVKVNVIANRWLGIFFCSVGCMLLNVVLYDSRLDMEYPRVVGFNELSRFALAPALYLAIVQFTTPGSRFTLKDSIHFVPFALFWLYMVPVLYFPQHQLIGGHFTLPPRINFVLGFCMRWSVNVQFLVYWVLAYRRLLQHKKHIELIASDTAPVQLSWLKYLLLSVGGMLALFFTVILFKIAISGAAIAFGYLVGALAILYYTLAQKEVYPFRVTELKAIAEVLADADAAARSPVQRVADERAQQLVIKLKTLMEVEALYKDAELSLPQLADAMEVSVHDLSFLLNDTVGMNFFRFVNGYRVEEAKQLMLSNKHTHLNLLGIAYHAGFSSKTTFNTAFKKQTGMSPTAFIRSAKGGEGQVSASV